MNSSGVFGEEGMRHGIVFICMIVFLVAAQAQAQAQEQEQEQEQEQQWLEAAVEDLAAASSGHRMVLLGEMHGTREIPVLAAAAVERMSRSEPVLLALEVHAREQESLDGYLRGDGSPEQRELLRQRPFWAVPPERNDGRRSEDMLDLVEAVRRLRMQGRDVAILAFDVANGGSRGSEWRDRAMAERLRSAWVALPRGRMLVLTGNVHAMRMRPDYAPAQMQLPMGADLQDLEPLSVEIAAQEGSFWACPGACKPVPVGVAGPPGHLSSAEPFQYRIVLPLFTPMRQVGSGTVTPGGSGARKTKP